MLTGYSTYKGSKIGWDNDECAAPLERPMPVIKDIKPPKAKKEAPVMNRFQLLNMDDTEDGSVDDDETSGIPITTAIGVVA